MLKVDEAPGWGSDAVSTWAEQHSIEVQIQAKLTPGPASLSADIGCCGERYRCILKIKDGFDGIQAALCWVLPALNQHTFVN